MTAATAANISEDQIGNMYYAMEMFLEELNVMPIALRRVLTMSWLPGGLMPVHQNTELESRRLDIIKTWALLSPDRIQTQTQASSGADIGLSSADMRAVVTPSRLGTRTFLIERDSPLND
jgi:hypothetical protein